MQLAAGRRWRVPLHHQQPAARRLRQVGDAWPAPPTACQSTDDRASHCWSRAPIAAWWTHDDDRRHDVACRFMTVAAVSHRSRRRVGLMEPAWWRHRPTAQRRRIGLIIYARRRNFFWEDLKLYSCQFSADRPIWVRSGIYRWMTDGWSYSYVMAFDDLLLTRQWRNTKHRKYEPFWEQSKITESMVKYNSNFELDKRTAVSPRRNPLATAPLSPPNSHPCFLYVTVYLRSFIVLNCLSSPHVYFYFLYPLQQRFSPIVVLHFIDPTFACLPPS